MRSDSAAAVRDALVARCGELALDGVDWLLVREKALEAGALVALTREIVAGAAGAKVLVARRPDVALAAGAHGVHLSGAAGELGPDQARRVMPGALVTVSCHSVEEVSRAMQQKPDAILFAPVFGKWVDGAEVMPAAGLVRLREAAEAARDVAVLALGGVTRENASVCLEAGAKGVAGIRLFFDSNVQKKRKLPR